MANVEINVRQHERDAAILAELEKIYRGGLSSVSVHPNVKKVYVRLFCTPSGGNSPFPAKVCVELTGSPDAIQIRDRILQLAGD